MKIVHVIVVLLTLTACGENSPKDKTMTVDPNSIRTIAIERDSLSQEQIQKIKIIQSTFADVYPESLEETITDFKKEADPDSEIDVWLKMVSAYTNYLRSRKDSLTINGKKEVFALVLSRSMMSPEEAIENARIMILSKQEAYKVLSFYK